MVKVERTFPAPASLEFESKKVSGSYAEPDVIEQLKKDFHNKCYICEMSDLQDPQVEHLLPHMNGKYPERKFDWNNLFWSCGHCNSVKNQEKYEEGIIDCCREDPEYLISFRLHNEEIHVRAKDKDNIKAALTAELVTEAFSLRNTEMRENPQSKVVLRKLKALLRRESKFAAFKRNYVREKKDDFPQLLTYIA